tara:strand:- start:961 stop:1539 length:579 start_codon:yes stop_codon:yes gene_type:complete
MISFGNKQLVLGSQSPRRKQLLVDLGLEFSTEPINADESFPVDMPVREVAGFLARKKAEAYPQSLSDKILITSDTTVVIGDLILNKPADLDEAREMLQQLSNNQHEVISGVCISTQDQVKSFSVTTEVTFRAIQPEELEYYLEKYQPLDKAGAYGIQEWIGQVAITELKGSYFNVVGLPTAELWQELQSFAI